MRRRGLVTFGLINEKMMKYEKIRKNTNENLGGKSPFVALRTPFLVCIDGRWIKSRVSDFNRVPLPTRPNRWSLLSRPEL